MSEQPPVYAPLAPPAPVKPGNPVGLASLIVAIFALVSAFIPILSLGAWIPALVAIGLAIGGLAARNRRRMSAAFGLTFGILAIIVGLVVSVIGAIMFASNVSDGIQQSENQAAELVTLTYEVTGDVATASDLSYSAYDDGNSGTSRVSDAPLPWTLSSQVERGGDFDFSLYSLTASTGADGGTVSCKITLDGVVVSENSATGPYAFASCRGSSSDLTD